MTRRRDLIRVHEYANLPVQATDVPSEVYLHVGAMLSCRRVKDDYPLTEVTMMGGRVYYVEEGPSQIENLIQGLGV